MFGKKVIDNFVTMCQNIFMIFLRTFTSQVSRKFLAICIYPVNAKRTGNCKFYTGNTVQSNKRKKIRFFSFFFFSSRTKEKWGILDRIFKPGHLVEKTSLQKCR